MGQIYEIVSIQRAEPPPDGKGANWYCYVIAFEGSNTITGCRQGSLKAVTSGVTEMIAQLNERHWKNAAVPTMFRRRKRRLSISL